jgi:hypothetical protein
MVRISQQRVLNPQTVFELLNSIPLIPRLHANKPQSFVYFGNVDILFTTILHPHGQSIGQPLSSKLLATGEVQDYSDVVKAIRAGSVLIAQMVDPNFQGSFETTHRFLEVLVLEVK